VVTIRAALNDLNTKQNKFLGNGKTKWFGSASASASGIRKTIEISVYRSKKANTDVGTRATWPESLVDGLV